MRCVVISLGCLFRLNDVVLHSNSHLRRRIQLSGAYFTQKTSAHHEHSSRTGMPPQLASANVEPTPLSHPELHPEMVQQPPACSAPPSRLSLREQTPSVTGTCAITQRRETRVCRGAPCRDASLGLVRSVVFPMDTPLSRFAKRQHCSHTARYTGHVSSTASRPVSTSSSAQTHQ